MAMSSGKSSSMAAVLLVVALVAGTCASGAQAQFNFTLRSSGVCTSPVVIRSESVNFNYTLSPGGSVYVGEPTLLFFLGPVTFTLATKGIRPIRPIEIPQNKLDHLALLRSALEKIEIRCDGDTYCIKVYETVRITNRGRTRVVTEMLGRFCSYS